MKRTFDQAGKKLTFEQALQLLSVNQIEVALGCIRADSPLPDAEIDLLELGQTVAGLGVGEGR